MKTNQKLRKALQEIREITEIDVSLFQVSGEYVEGTNAQTPRGEYVREFLERDLEYDLYPDGMYFRVVMEGDTEYVLVMDTKEDAAVLGRMAVCQIRNLLLSQAENYDRNTFIRNLLLGNLLPVDLNSKAKKLHISNAKRVVYVIDTGNKNNETVLELVRNLSDMKSGDFVTNVDEHSVVLVKELANIAEEQMEQELKQIADRLVDNLHMEAMIKIRVGYGNIVTKISDITQSFQEARMALEVGRVFYAEYDTISYGRLGIGRLIYQLPMSLCQMYIKEVFDGKIPEILEDEEVMSTINKFFENNLNISETARQLYLHRNTLVYRLERIEKAIGLDIRTFEDAMTFRIAVMVIAHMKCLES